jgi:3-methyladenine DNA glycosylase AlkD
MTGGVSSRASSPGQADRVREALQWLERRGSQRAREEMLTRYGINAPKAFGVPMSAIQQLGKRLGRNHALAAALWETGWYEARSLAAYVDDPAQVTAAQMERWVRDFDNWAICDTMCFKLWDQTPHAWGKVEQWTRRRDEFVKRAGFVLLACLALHDKAAADQRFLRSLRLIERAASDERNFVKKAVSWALRGIGRRNRTLRAAALDIARQLADSSDATERWIGKDALRELAGPVVRRRLARRRSKA